MIKVNSGTVHLTEVTLRELLKAVEEAKEVTEFTNNPMPNGDMCPDHHTLLERERGTITVSSDFSKIKYKCRDSTTVNGISRISLGSGGETKAFK